MIRMVAISEVAEVNPSFPRASNLAPESLVSFLPMAAVSETGIIFVQDERPFSEVSKGYTYFAEGDVLMAKITPCMENGKATFVNKLKHSAGFGSTEFHVLRPGSEIDGKYLFYMIWNPLFRKVAGRNMTGTAGQKRVPSSFLKDFTIPLPPLPEQKRIAAILDKADSNRRKRQEAVRLTEELLRSVFLEMFGDPESNNWPMTTIAGIAKPESGAIRTGPFGSQLLHSEFVDEGIAVLGIDNAVANEFRWSERRFISKAKYRELSRYTVKPGDVIITIMGTCGRCAVVPDNIPVAINTKHLCCITLDQTKFLPAFVHAYFLQHRIARRYLDKTAKGAIMDGLNMGIIKDMPIPIPPLKLQHKFACSIAAIEKLRITNRSALAEQDRLFNSLLQRAFTGKL